MLYGGDGKAGVIEALGAALLFGLAAPLAKRYLSGIPALEASGLLYLGAGLLTGAIHGLSRARQRPDGPRRETPPSRADLPALAGSIVFGGLVAPALLLFGLARSSGTVASLLLNLETVFTVLLAVSFGESLGRRNGAGIVAIFLGGALLAVDPARLGAASFGATLSIAGACLAWAVDNILARRLSARDPLAIVATKGLVAGPLALCIAWTVGARPPAASILLVALALGAWSYGLSLILFQLALRHLGAARTGGMFATAPFIGAIAAVVVLKEQPSWLTGGAGMLMAAGVLLLMSEQHDHEHTHGWLEHDHAHVHDEHHQHAHEGHEGPHPHAHLHLHRPSTHRHAHFPDEHHRHRH